MASPFRASDYDEVDNLPATQGVCRTFASTQEQAERVNGKLLSDCEGRAQDGNIWPLVARYTRSEAGMVMTQHDVRTPDTLCQASRHLLVDVVGRLDIEPDHIYGFVADRLRECRKQAGMQRHVSVQWLRCSVSSVAYHCIASYAFAGVRFTQGQSAGADTDETFWASDGPHAGGTYEDAINDQRLADSLGRGVSCAAALLSALPLLGTPSDTDTGGPPPSDERVPTQQAPTHSPSRYLRSPARFSHSFVELQDRALELLSLRLYLCCVRLLFHATEGSALAQTHALQSASQALAALAQALSRLPAIEQPSGCRSLLSLYASCVRFVSCMHAGHAAGALRTADSIQAIHGAAHENEDRGDIRSRMTAWEQLARLSLRCVLHRHVPALRGRVLSSLCSCVLPTRPVPLSVAHLIHFLNLHGHGHGKHAGSGHDGQDTSRGKLPTYEYEPAWYIALRTVMQHGLTVTGPAEVSVPPFFALAASPAAAVQVQAAAVPWTSKHVINRLIVWRNAMERQERDEGQSKSRSGIAAGSFRVTDSVPLGPGGETVSIVLEKSKAAAVDNALAGFSAAPGVQGGPSAQSATLKQRIALTPVREDGAVLFSSWQNVAHLLADVMDGHSFPSTPRRLWCSSCSDADGLSGAPVSLPVHAETALLGGCKGEHETNGDIQAARQQAAAGGRRSLEEDAFQSFEI